MCNALQLMTANGDLLVVHLTNLRQPLYLKLYLEMDEPPKADGLRRPKYTWNPFRNLLFKAESG